MRLTSKNSYLARRRIWPFYSSSALVRLGRRVESGNINAAEIDSDITKFEDLFSKRFCPGYYTLFCNSGTSALNSAFFCLDLRPGDEVLAPIFTFRATVTSALPFGLRPILCDVDPSTRCISLKSIVSKFSSKARAIIVTHQWGHPCDMGSILSFAKAHNLRVIEDCSHAHGASWEGRKVGTWGDVAAFSCGGTKMISGGLAGVFVTKNRDLYERALLLGQPKARLEQEVIDPRLKKFRSTGLGMNLRGSPLAAILALDHLTYFDKRLLIKKQNLDHLSRMLSEELPELLPPFEDRKISSGVWYNYVCRWTGRKMACTDLIIGLMNAGIRVRPAGRPLSHEAFYRSGLATGVFSVLPSKGDEVVRCDWRNLVIWDTREFYDNADNLIESYKKIIRKLKKSYGV